MGPFKIACTIVLLKFIKYLQFCARIAGPIFLSTGNTAFSQDFAYLKNYSYYLT